MSDSPTKRKFQKKRKNFQQRYQIQYIVKQETVTSPKASSEKIQFTSPKHPYYIYYEEKSSKSVASQNSLQEQSNNASEKKLELEVNEQDISSKSDYVVSNIMKSGSNPLRDSEQNSLHQIKEEEEEKQQHKIEQQQQQLIVNLSEIDKIETSQIQFTQQIDNEKQFQKNELLQDNFEIIQRSQNYNQKEEISDTPNLQSPPNIINQESPFKVENQDIVGQFEKIEKVQEQNVILDQQEQQQNKQQIINSFESQQNNQEQILQQIDKQPQEKQNLMANEENFETIIIEKQNIVNNITPQVDNNLNENIIKSNQETAVPKQLEQNEKSDISQPKEVIDERKNELETINQTDNKEVEQNDDNIEIEFNLDQIQQDQQQEQHQDELLVHAGNIEEEQDQNNNNKQIEEEQKQQDNQQQNIQDEQKGHIQIQQTIQQEANKMQQNDNNIQIEQIVNREINSEQDHQINKEDSTIQQQTIQQASNYKSPNIDQNPLENISSESSNKLKENNMFPQQLTQFNSVVPEEEVKHQQQQIIQEESKKECEPIQDQQEEESQLKQGIKNFFEKLKNIPTFMQEKKFLSYKDRIFNNVQDRIQEADTLLKQGQKYFNQQQFDYCSMNLTIAIEILHLIHFEKDMQQFKICINLLKQLFQLKISAEFNLQHFEQVINLVDTVLCIDEDNKEYIIIKYQSLKKLGRNFEATQLQNSNQEIINKLLEINNDDDNNNTANINNINVDDSQDLQEVEQNQLDSQNNTSQININNAKQVGKQVGMIVASTITGYMLMKLFVKNAKAKIFGGILGTALSIFAVNKVQYFSKID